MTKSSPTAAGMPVDLDGPFPSVTVSNGFGVWGLTDEGLVTVCDPMDGSWWHQGVTGPAAGVPVAQRQAWLEDYVARIPKGSS